MWILQYALINYSRYITINSRGNNGGDNMIEKFEREYLDYYWKNKTFQWKNYFENGNYNLSSIDAVTIENGAVGWLKIYTTAQEETLQCI